MTVTHALDGRATPAGGSAIRLPVELDMATAGDLLPAIADACRTAVDAIVFDCTALTFIDASGIGVLVRAANAAAEVGLQARLVHPGAALCRLLLLTDVGHRFVVDAG